MRGPPALGCFGGVLCPAFSSTPDAAPAKKSAAKALKSPLEAAVSGEAESALFEDNTLRRSIISPRAGAYAKPHGDVSASERRGETAGYLGARQAHVSEDGASVEVPQHETPDQSSEDDEEATVSVKVGAPSHEAKAPRAGPAPACLGRLFEPSAGARSSAKGSCLSKSHSACSLVSESSLEEFEEDAKTLARAACPTRVTFDFGKNERHDIPNLDDFGWRCRRECYWQPEEYAAMSQSRLRLERAVLETGGRVPIQGESRRGLGLVCEPETRLARASKIQQTSRAVLRMHAEGASAARLARFAADASKWATNNALITAEKDLDAARAALAEPPSATPKVLRTTPSGAPPPPPGPMPRCDSNTASTDGLASMIRNDSLNNMATLVEVSQQKSPISALESYSASRTRHRIAPAAAAYR